jgi:DNA-binding transcriptional LysR family regulator
VNKKKQKNFSFITLRAAAQPVFLTAFLVPDHHVRRGMALPPAGRLTWIMPIQFDFVTLRLFVAVAEEGSIAKAALRENIAASAISKRIADLEYALGVALIQRHRRGVVTTAPGNALLRHARSVLRDLGQLEGELAEHSQGLKGQVRLFATSTAILRFLPRQLVSFLSHHPLVQIEIEESISPTILKAVADRVGEIGIFGGGVPSPDLHILPYRQDRLSVIVPKRHKLAGRGSIRFAAIVDQDFVGLQAGSSIDALTERAAGELGKSLRRRIRMTGFDPLCRMVEAGLGVGVVPESIAVHYARTLAITRLTLEEPWSRRSLKLASYPPASLAFAARLLLEHLANPDT